MNFDKKEQRLAELASSDPNTNREVILKYLLKAGCLKPSDIPKDWKY